METPSPAEAHVRELRVVLPAVGASGVQQEDRRTVARALGVNPGRCAVIQREAVVPPGDPRRVSLGGLARRRGQASTQQLQQALEEMKRARKSERIAGDSEVTEPPERGDGVVARRR